MLNTRSNFHLDKRKKIYTIYVATVQRKIKETGRIDTSNTHIQYSSLSRLGTGTSIKSLKVFFSL